MHRLIAVVAVAAASVSLATLTFGAETVASRQQLDRQEPRPSQTQELLTDAAVVAAMIAASIANYKSMGKPCPCPEDKTANGRSCGGNSAWSRPGGYKPLCYPTDVTPDMILAYRKKK
jgi:hypothetical protein